MKIAKPKGKPMTRAELWRRLQGRALVDGELPPASTPTPTQGLPSPWYVRVMLGVAGWIGALFLLGFVGAVFAVVLRSAGASILVGGLACLGAYLIFRAARENDFGTQFGLAASLAGQSLVMFGLFDSFKFDGASAFFIACLIEIGLALLMPNFIHRVLSSWAAMAALSFGLSKIGLHGVAPGIAAAGVALVWLNELRWISADAVWRPIGYGLVLALLQIAAMPLAGEFDWLLSSAGRNGWLYPHAAQIGCSLIAAVLLMSVLRLLAREGVAPASGIGIAAIGATVVLAAVSYFAPGLAAALLVLLLGVAAGNRALAGLGLLALGGFVSHYYYQLQQTLLLKSMVLAVSGAMLLGARAALNRWLGPAQEDHDGYDGHDGHEEQINA
ncbi:MAG: DUF4401 domain-containing protein [Pseudomonadota bacterium]